VVVRNCRKGKKSQRATKASRVGKEGLYEPVVWPGYRRIWRIDPPLVAASMGRWKRVDYPVEEVVLKGTRLGQPERTGELCESERTQINKMGGVVMWTKKANVV